MGSGQANRLVQFLEGRRSSRLGWGDRRRFGRAASMALCPSMIGLGPARFITTGDPCYTNGSFRVSQSARSVERTCGSRQTRRVANAAPIKLAPGERMTCAKSHGSRCAVCGSYTS
jgi:hypothetical protein